VAPTPNSGWTALRDRALQGDVAAAEDLSQQICSRAYRIALAVLRQPDPAQDVAQSTWLKVLPYWPSFAHDGQFKVFVDVTARNRAIDELRRQRPGGGPLPRTEGEDTGRPGPVDPGPGPFDIASNNERRQQLYACIGQLEDLERKIVLLRLAGYSNIEIAVLLGMTNERVGVLYHRATQKLRRCMENAMMRRPDVMEVE
jgi:RNA polymerase sigma-70 factor (ECF subfamily)